MEKSGVLTDQILGAYGPKGGQILHLFRTGLKHNTLYIITFNKFLRLSRIGLKPQHYVYNQIKSLEPTDPREVKFYV